MIASAFPYLYSKSLVYIKARSEFAGKPCPPNVTAESTDCIPAENEFDDIQPSAQQSGPKLNPEGYPIDQAQLESSPQKQNTPSESSTEQSPRAKINPSLSPKARAQLLSLVNDLKETDGLSSKQKVAYFQSMQSVLGEMTPKALERFSAGLTKGAKFYPDHEGIREGLKDQHKDNPRVMAKLEAAGTPGGCYSKKGGETSLHLDGGYTEELKSASHKMQVTTDIYAHEFAHSIDGPSDEISRSKEWLSAYKSEIVNGGLTGYATTHPVEGFAEFGRLILAGRHDLGKVKARFPQCWAVWEKWGLVENKDTTQVKSLNNDELLPEIFSERVDLDGMGHLDILLDDEQFTDDFSGEKSLTNHKYGCVLIVIPDPIRKQITDWSIEHLQDEHLALDGRDLRPHCTILYGFRDYSEEIIQGIRALLTRYGPIKIKLGDSLSTFPMGKDGVPLIVPIESPQLHELNLLFRDSFDVFVKFPEYQPHLTLGYLREEAKDIYLEEHPPFLNKEIILSEAEWSSPDGNRETIPLSFLLHDPVNNRTITVEELTEGYANQVREAVFLDKRSLGIKSAFHNRKDMSYLTKARSEFADKPCPPNVTAESTDCIPAEDEPGQEKQPQPEQTGPKLNPDGYPVGQIESQQNYSRLGPVGEFVAKQEYADKGTKSKYFKGWFGDWETDPQNSSKVINNVTGEPQETHNLTAKAISRVTNKYGEPLVVFHGTPMGGFRRFDEGKIFKPEQLLYGPGFYFTEDYDIATDYLRNKERPYDPIPEESEVKSVFLNIRNPLDMDARLSDEESEKLRSLLSEYTSKAKDKRELNQINGWLEAWNNNPDIKTEDVYIWMFYAVGKKNTQKILSEAGYDGITHIGGNIVGNKLHRVWIAFDPSQIKSVNNTGTFNPSGVDMYKSVEIGTRSEYADESCPRESTFRKDMSWLANGSGGALVKPPQIGDRKSQEDMISLLREACESFLDIPGLGPDYQRLFWNSTENHAWWESFDGDEEDEVVQIRERLEKIPGVVKVTIESEVSPPRNGGWELIWPKQKQWKSLLIGAPFRYATKQFTGYFTKGAGEYCLPGETKEQTGCTPIPKESGQEQQQGQQEQQQTGPKLNPEGYPIQQTGSSSVQLSQGTFNNSHNWLNGYVFGIVGKDPNVSDIPDPGVIKGFADFTPNEPVVLYRYVKQKKGSGSTGQQLRSWTYSQDFAESFLELYGEGKVIKKRIYPDEVLVDTTKLPSDYANDVVESQQEVIVVYGDLLKEMREIRGTTPPSLNKEKLPGGVEDAKTTKLQELSQNKPGPTLFPHARSGVNPTRPGYPGGGLMGHAGDVRRVVEEAKREAAQNQVELTPEQEAQSKQEIEEISRRQAEQTRAFREERYREFLERIKKRGGKITGLNAVDKPIARALEDQGKLERRGNTYYLKSFSSYQTKSQSEFAGKPCPPNVRADLTRCIPEDEPGQEQQTQSEQTGPKLNPEGYLENKPTSAFEDKDNTKNELAIEDYKKNGVRAKSFKEWFGDWEQNPSEASKVVNRKTGEPQETYEITKVFHGTWSSFQKFDERLINKFSAVGAGFYFSENKHIAEEYEYDGEIIEAYLNIRNPFVFESYLDIEKVKELGSVAKSMFVKFDKDGFDKHIDKSLKKRGRLSGYFVWNSLLAVGRDRVNDILQKSGYDGISHLSKDTFGTPNNPEFGDSSVYDSRCWIAFKPNQIKAVDNEGTFNSSDYFRKRLSFYSTKSRFNNLIRPASFQFKLLGYQNKAFCKQGQRSDLIGCTKRDNEVSQRKTPKEESKQTKVQTAKQFIQSIKGSIISHKEAMITVAKRMGDAAWNKLPLKAQDRLAKTYRIAKAIEHKIFMGFRKSRELALEIAKEKGLDEEQTKRLERLLKITDGALAWTVNMPVTIAVTGSVTAGKAASWIPVASLCYIAGSTTRNPNRTIRAARKMIREALASKQGTKSLILPAPLYCRKSLVYIKARSEFAGKPCPPNVTAESTDCIPTEDESGDMQPSAQQSGPKLNPEGYPVQQTAEETVDELDKREAAQKEKQKQSALQKEGRLKMEERKELEEQLAEYLDKSIETSLEQIHGMTYSEAMQKSEVDGIKVYWGEKSKFSIGESLKMLKDMHQKMPEKLWKVNKNIVFTEQKSNLDSHWEKEFNMPGFEAAATGGDGDIAVYNGKKMSPGTYAHESGHNLAVSLWGTVHPPADSDYGKTQKMGINGRVTNAVSEYGSNNRAEDFAEACRLYVDENLVYDVHDDVWISEREIFKEQYPNKFKALEELFK